MQETQDGGSRAVCWDLTDDLSMVGKTRAMVRETLTAWAAPVAADDVVLVVGELLANALTYGEPPVRLSLWLGAGALCVRVTDRGAEPPRHLDLDVEAVHGRGLIIVDALADDTGVTPLPDGRGKTVWCRWHLPARAADTQRPR
ncbi:ATP-binding protein [Sphaerisporangium aureirubrum]|uniref:ATP-binding protein n=1 Tax=Sphaerisporangium aureirubrum TaxID=1544736 RepID=A0ABW1NP19_9ACTN